jgi:hypothetical protein
MQAAEKLDIGMGLKLTCRTVAIADVCLADSHATALARATKPSEWPFP